MIKPSFVISVKDGKPSLEVLTLDADEALDFYKDSEAEVYLFIRPGYSKRKRAIKKAEPAKKAAKKAGKKAP
jgi:hypothetical protein